MNEFKRFEGYMKKLGAIPTPKTSGCCPFFTLNKYIEIQIRSTPEQHETDLISVHVALRKPGFYFPIGDAWAMSAVGILEKIQALLYEYNMDISLVLRASW